MEARLVRIQPPAALTEIGIAKTEATMATNKFKIDDALDLATDEVSRSVQERSLGPLHPFFELVAA